MFTDTYPFFGGLVTVFNAVKNNVISPMMNYLSNSGGGGALLGSLASLGSSFMTHRASSNAEDKAWNRTTAYNHPKAQKERLIEAGLNPNLLYSSAGASAGNTTADIQQRQPFTLQDNIHRYLTLEAMHANNALLKANTENVRVDTAYKVKEAGLLGDYGLKTDPNWFKAGLRSYNFGKKTFSKLFDPNSDAFKEKLYNDNLRRLKRK